MLISVASGKGGTGKTTVAVNLALAACSEEFRQSGGNVQLLDCDVEEPNCHIFINPAIETRHEVSVPVPQVDEDACSRSGICGDVCAFHAIMPGKHMVLVFPELCHGCGACAMLCPSKAITEIPRSVGTVESGYGYAKNTGRENSAALSNGPLGKFQFSHGVLNPGEALAPPIIGQVKDKAISDGTVIIDTPPGTSCSMVESVRGTDFCLLVTEPTPFGLHDLGLAVDALAKLGIPCGVVINRSDLGDSGVRQYCRDKSIPVLLEIPLDRKIAELYAKGIPLVTGSEEYSRMFSLLLECVIDEAIRGKTNSEQGGV